MPIFAGAGGQAWLPGTFDMAVFGTQIATLNSSGVVSTVEACRIWVGEDLRRTVQSSEKAAKPHDSFENVAIRHLLSSICVA
jgi:hypothetical protein